MSRNSRSPEASCREHFVCLLWEGTVTDVTALGDNINITARLASKAGPGEALISDVAHAAAGLNLGDLEHLKRRAAWQRRLQIVRWLAAAGLRR